MNSEVISVVIAGLGGQGILRASDILADVAFAAGWDVKKSEVHGMSQRGGSVNSDVRFGSRVYSPVISPGEADFLVLLAPEWQEHFQHYLKPDGELLSASEIDVAALPHRRSLNLALLGQLSRRLDFEETLWIGAIRRRFPPELVPVNEAAFRLGRETA
ncbi:MAG: pyruvate ferredoxin oxidoreductase [Verrucomicrobia bacterium]|nr:MAG: pyruvate ferredoxin oxidoreductase [Verrucomicrobiota bacterium]